MQVRLRVLLILANGQHRIHNTLRDVIGQLLVQFGPERSARHFNQQIAVNGRRLLELVQQLDERIVGSLEAFRDQVGMNALKMFLI